MAGGVTTRTLGVGSRWCWVVNFKPRSVYLAGEVSNHIGKGPQQLLWAGSRAAHVKLQQVVYLTS